MPPSKKFAVNENGEILIEPTPLDKFGNRITEPTTEGKNSNSFFAPPTDIRFSAYSSTRSAKLRRLQKLVSTHWYFMAPNEKSGAVAELVERACSLGFCPDYFLCNEVSVESQEAIRLANDVFQEQHNITIPTIYFQETTDKTLVEITPEVLMEGVFTHPHYAHQKICFVALDSFLSGCCNYLRAMDLSSFSTKLRSELSLKPPMAKGPKADQEGELDDYQRELLNEEDNAPDHDKLTHEYQMFQKEYVKGEGIPSSAFSITLADDTDVQTRWYVPSQVPVGLILEFCIAETRAVTTMERANYRSFNIRHTRSFSKDKMCEVHRYILMPGQLTRLELKRREQHATDSGGGGSAPKKPQKARWHRNSKEKFKSLSNLIAETHNLGGCVGMRTLNFDNTDAGRKTAKFSNKRTSWSGVPTYLQLTNKPAREMYRTYFKKRPGGELSVIVAEPTSVLGLATEIAQNTNQRKPSKREMEATMAESEVFELIDFVPNLPFVGHSTTVCNNKHRTMMVRPIKHSADRGERLKESRRAEMLSHAFSNALSERSADPMAKFPIVDQMVLKEFQANIVKNFRPVK